MNKPNLFLIGAPKCGTTSLYYYLRNHPEVFFPEYKEPHFFATDLKNRNSKVIDKLHEYREMYKGAQHEKYLGDASVFYLYSQVAAENISFFNKKAKIVCMLRNPVDMIFSMFTFALRHGAENVNDFEQALSLEQTRKEGKKVPPAIFLEEMVYYRSISDFQPQLERYYKMFSSDDIHIILYDDFSNNRAMVNKALSDFLGISYFQEDQENHVNKTDSIVFDRSKVLNRTYKKEMELFRKVVPNSIREKLQFIKKFVVRDQKIPEQIPSCMKELLIHEYRPKIEKLSCFINKDLSHWLN